MSAIRRARLRELITAHPVDGLLVLGHADIRYLSGFSGSNVALFISAGDAADDVIATDARYSEQVAHEAPELPAIIDRATVHELARQLAAHGVTSVALESTGSLADLEVIRAHLREVRVVEPMVPELRMMKDDAELDALARACAITARAMEALFEEIAPGWTEIEVARRLETLFGVLGAPDRAFATIVAAGANGSLPHHRPNTTRLRSGDLVIVDAGAEVDGYHADMTRTVVVGEPAAWQIEIHEVVDRAAAAARAAAVPGADLRELDAVARDVIAEAGYGDAFGHGLGHGVGLVIHEAPMIGPRAVGRLCASTPITIEPGVYLPGRGGVRIEDTLVVGSGEVLTESDRSLRSVG